MTPWITPHSAGRLSAALAASEIRYKAPRAASDRFSAVTSRATAIRNWSDSDHRADHIM